MGDKKASPKPTDVKMGADAHSMVTINQRREDTDLQVGIMPRPVRVRVRAEGSGGQRQEHGTCAPHGQQRAAERRSPESTRQEEKCVPHHQKKEEKTNSLI